MFIFFLKKRIIILIITQQILRMSNEEHIEEMYYFAHLSGVFTEFSSEILKEKNLNPKTCLSEIVQSVFEDFIVRGLIEDDFHLFI